MDRNCEVCKHHTEKGCCKWECQFEPKLSERDLHFRYLDGCADGLNEARKDTIRELETIKAEIEEHNRKYLSDDNAGLERAIWDFIEPHINKLKGGAE